ncbi:metallopeptidase family protein [Paenochrobactrum sp. BZR 588]|uniref:metallopeptidase family protein n=1 Tax=Paenochrobactrum TaxID=999488 RepID=UPI0035BBD65A
MPQSDQTGIWASRLAPNLTEIESLTFQAYAHLPQEFRELCPDMTIHVADFPDDSIIEDLGLDTPFDLLGLFEGEGLGERFTLQTDNQRPNRMTLFRRAILDYWCEHDETLHEIITHVLIHEIGHHFGLDDDSMMSLEEAN